MQVPVMVQQERFWLWSWCLWRLWLVPPWRMAPYHACSLSSLAERPGVEGSALPNGRPGSESRHADTYSPFAHSSRN